MAETIHVHLPDFSGDATLRLELVGENTGVLLNAGGDALDEAPVSSGRFQTTLTEPRTGLGTLAARVYSGVTSPDNLVWDGWLSEDMSLIVEDYPVSGGSSLDEPVPELAAPPASLSSLADKITYMFMWHRNRATQTANQRTLYADNSTTVVSTEAVDNDGVVYDKSEAV